MSPEDFCAAVERISEHLEKTRPQNKQSERGEPPVMKHVKEVERVMRDFESGLGERYEVAQNEIVNHFWALLREAIAADEAAQANIAPIAKVRIYRGQVLNCSQYAPGLPDGEHDLYPVAGSLWSEVMKHLKENEGPQS